MPTSLPMLRTETVAYLRTSCLTGEAETVCEAVGSLIAYCVTYGIPRTLESYCEHNNTRAGSRRAFTLSPIG